MISKTEAHLISRYRSELMGFAMLWVMLFHCFLTRILPACWLVVGLHKVLEWGVSQAERRLLPKQT